MKLIDAYTTIKYLRESIQGGTAAHAFVLAQFDKWLNTIERDIQLHGPNVPFEPPSYVEMFIGPSWID